MASIEEKPKQGGMISGENNLLEGMKLLKEMQDHNEVKKTINSELWHACAGPLVTLPQVGSLVFYFPQGHIEQVAVSTNRTATAQIPNYPNLPSQLLCKVHNVILHADKDTDEIYAQMSLQPVNSEKDVFPIPNFGLKASKHPTEFFCKTFTACDTSTHGGFSVPRRAAEKLFPQLDYSMQPPTQELVRDLHDNTWSFRHRAAKAASSYIWEDICAFRVFPYKCHTSFELFELKDDYIQQEISKPPSQGSRS